MRARKRAWPFIQIVEVEQISLAILEAPKVAVQPQGLALVLVPEVGDHH